MDLGDISRACRLLEAEARRRPTNSQTRLRLALLKEALGEREAAAAELTRALRWSPTDESAARRLATLLSQGRLGPAAVLDPAGLAACLHHRTIDRDLVGAAAIDQLSRRGALADAFEKARRTSFDEAAASVLARRSSPLLRDELLLAVLRQCTVTSFDLEQLLTAMRRRLLLDVSVERLAEAELGTFVAALAMQLRSNEYVLGETDEESQQLGSLTSAPASALAGDPIAGNRLLLYALYRDPTTIMPVDIDLRDIERISPAHVSRLLIAMVDENRSIQKLGADIQQFDDIHDATSLKVKAQYESHPYPRWRGSSLFPSDHYIQYLETFFSRAELAFVGAPSRY